MNSSGIYCIQNKITNKVYIGSSCNLNKRKREHFRKLKLNIHKNIKLQNSYNKHGLENFEFFVIENCGKEKLIESEQFYFDVFEPQLNILKIAGNTAGYKHTYEAKQKISQSSKGRVYSTEIKKIFSEAQKRKPSLGMLNKNHTRESKIKTSMSLAKPFKLLSPTGELVEGVHLKNFCKENNLSYTNIHAVLKGRRKSHKGFKKLSF